jgi:hypothetical protein
MMMPASLGHLVKKRRAAQIPVQWVDDLLDVVQQTPGEYTPDGWYRIIESISAEPDEYMLQTALVFSLDEKKDKDGNRLCRESRRRGTGSLRSAGAASSL